MDTAPLVVQPLKVIQPFLMTGPIKIPKPTIIKTKNTQPSVFSLKAAKQP